MFAIADADREYEEDQFDEDEALEVKKDQKQMLASSDDNK